MSLRILLKERMARWEIEHKKRLSFAELAKQTGISAQTLSKIADPTADYSTSTRHLEALCTFFGVGLNEMMLLETKAEKEGN